VSTRTVETAVRFRIEEKEYIIVLKSVDPVITITPQLNEWSPILVTSDTGMQGNVF